MFYLDRLENRLLLAAAPAHVVVVIEENHSNSEIIGNPDAPYTNSLAQNGLSFADAHGLTHPSQPNYLALFSGSTQGVIDNNGPLSFINVPNLGSQLFAAGKSFIGYAEGLPEVGSQVLTEGYYDRRHNPWVDFKNIPDSSNRPFSDFPTDYSTLPTVSFVVPNELDNSHDGPIADADTWLENNLGGYADWAKSHNSLLIVTWDEGFDPLNHIPTIFYGANANPAQYYPTINHYNILRTLQDLYGLAPLSQSLHAPGIDYAHLASTPDLTPASDSGPSQTDNITNITTPTFTGIAATGQTVKIYADGFETGSAIGAANAYSIKSATLSTGVHTLLAATVDSTGNLISLSAPLTLTIDRSPPKITAISFNNEPASISVRQITLTFNEPVNISSTQLTLHNNTTGKSITPAAMSMTYNQLTHQAAWTFPTLPMGLLENGQYTATLSANITDQARNPLATTPTNPRTFQSTQLPDDINTDGTVNATDFKLLYTNIGNTNTTPADLNGDGQVGFIDFQILELNYGQSTPTAAVQAPETTSPVRTTPRPPKITKPPFSHKQIKRL